MEPAKAVIMSDKSTDHIDSDKYMRRLPQSNRPGQNVGIDHTSVNGTCQSCHLSDKSTDHMLTTASTCGDCHNPNGWLEI